MSRLDRVIFFSVRDLMRTHMLEKAVLLLEKQHDFSQMGLNDLLEFHHIQQYFDNQLFLDSWTPEQKKVYAQTVKTALSATRIYLVKCIPDNLIAEIDLLEFDNRENFWIIVRYFELYKTINHALLSAILGTYPTHIRYILPLKQLVEHYNTTLRSFLMTCEQGAELLLTHYEQKNTDPNNYHFPKSLSDTDKQTIITAYLESPEPNLNFVELVRNSKNIKLTNKILLKAKKVAEGVKDQLLSDENANKLSVGASLDPSQSEPVIYKNSGTHTSMCYGGLFFDSLNDIQLFSVFSDLFVYTDEEGLITLINKDTEMDVLEKIGMKSRNEYHTGIIFTHKDMTSLGQLGILDHYLKQKGRSIENLLENTIKALFNEHFGIDQLTFKMPDANLGPTEKIRLLAPEIEYFIKQFKHFVTDGEIDHELLQIDSMPLYFSELPSFRTRKYIYSDHDAIKIIQYHFFDENSILADRKNKSQRTLIQRFKAGPVYKSDFEPYQLPTIEQASTQGDLKIRDDGLIEITDQPKVIIAGKLRKNGVISYWHFARPFRAEIDRLIADGLLTTSDRLLTADEISYLNFYFNKKEFTNGLDLRNKYVHGSNNHEAEQQIMDYLYFLRTFVLILLKLRNDLILKKYYDSMNRGADMDE